MAGVGRAGGDRLGMRGGGVRRRRRAAVVEERHHLREQCRALPLALHRAVVRRRHAARLRALHVHAQLEELEHHRLDRGGRRAHHRALIARLLEPRAQPPQRGRPLGEGALEAEREHALHEHRREARAQHRRVHAQQRGGHALHHQRVAVRLHEREQRRDDRRLAQSHDHVLDEAAARGAVLRRRRAEALHRLDLLAAQHKVADVLEDEQPRVEAEALLHQRLVLLRADAAVGVAVVRRAARLLVPEALHLGGAVAQRGGPEVVAADAQHRRQRRAFLPQPLHGGA
jgi:hypothetical protein